MSMFVASLLMFLGLPEQVTPPSCPEGEWESLRAKRKAAYHRADYVRTLDLVDCEAETMRRLAAAGARLHASNGDPASHCQPLDVGFYVCNTLKQDRACSDRYLDRQFAEGCCDDPMYAVECHQNLAQRDRQREDFPAALQALDTVEALSLDNLAREHLGMAEFEAWSGLATAAALRIELAGQLADVGAVRATLEEFREWSAFASSESGMGLAADLGNLAAWGVLLLQEANPANPAGISDLADEVEVLLESALDTFSRSEGPASKADNVRINLALAALQRGDAERATAWLSEVVERGLPIEERLWFQYISIRAALASGAPIALDQSLRVLDELVGVDSVPMAGWFAAWALGQARDATGDIQGALQAYRTAEELLDTHTRTRAPAQRVFLGGRAQPMFGAVSRRLVGLLLEAGDVAAAASVARGARNRAMRASARGDCVATRAERRPLPGELQLVYFQVASRRAPLELRWVGFAVTAAGVRAEMLDVGEPAGDLTRLSDTALKPWADALLRPFQAELADASVVTILATESLHEVPFHALPWAKGLLIDALPVQYALDVAGCDARVRCASGGARVVRGDGPAVAEEVEAVAKILAENGRVVEHLRPQAVSDPKRLQAHGADILHVIAHGGASDRLLASDDELMFSDSISLTSRTVLTWREAPQLVYLSACRTSFRDAETLGGDASLAHAFLLAGAHYVVASVDLLDGEAAKEFAVRFHRAMGAGGAEGAPAAFRAAFRGCREQCKPSWSPYLRRLRVITR